MVFVKENLLPTTTSINRENRNRKKRRSECRKAGR